MKAEITMSQLWWNPSIMGFFFREQAKNRFEELLELVDEDTESICGIIDDKYENLDDFEEEMYCEDFDYIIAYLGLTPLNNEEEEEEEEEE